MRKTVDIILRDALKTNIEKMEEIRDKKLSSEIVEGFMLNFALNKNMNADDFVNFAKQVVLDNNVSIYTLFYMLK